MPFIYLVHFTKIKNAEMAFNHQLKLNITIRHTPLDTTMKRLVIYM